MGGGLLGALAGGWRRLSKTLGRAFGARPGPSSRPAPARRRAAHPPETAGRAGGDRGREDRGREDRAASAGAGPEPPPPRPAAAPEPGRPAAPSPAAPIGPAELAMLARLRERIERGRFELPQLRTSELDLMRLVADPAVEIAEVVREIERSPSLSAQVLRVANSALYATSSPAETVREGVMRIGTRALRGVLLASSMRGLLLGNGALGDAAAEVWRESGERAELARLLAPRLGLDPEHAYLIGLLQDVGKVSLLAMMRRERPEPGPSAIRAAFAMHHERAGRAMAERWRLGEEIRSIAGCHHDFRANESHPRGAAFASFLHRVEAALARGDDRALDALGAAPELDVLGARGEEAVAGILAALRSRAETREAAPA